jgi:hypothetical protein
MHRILRLGSNLQLVLGQTNIYGIGQGSCVSPILWDLPNQLLIAALGKKYDCIRLIAVDGIEEC